MGRKNSNFKYFFHISVLFLQLICPSHEQSEQGALNLKQFNDMWAEISKDKSYGSVIPYADIKAYTDLTIPNLGPMYDEGAKAYVFKYWTDTNLAVYKKYLFQEVIDEWFLHVPCYSMKNLAESKALKCPPDDPELLSGNEAIDFAGAICVTDKFGCNVEYSKDYKVHVISMDNMRRCPPSRIHAFVARALGVRSPIQEPDRNEHVTVNFENVEIGLSERYFESDLWRDEYPMLLEDLDYCRRTSEEVYHMKTATFKKGIFDYSSVLVPETFQYSDPIDPRPVTVAKEIYEQVRLDRSKYDSDFRLPLVGSDLFRMRLFFTCGSNGQCFKKDGVCKNMGFIGSSPLVDLARRKGEPVSCECVCPYSDLKGEFCEENAFMKYKYLDSKAMCFGFITKNGNIHVEKLRGTLHAERGRNVLSPKAAQSYVYDKREIFTDEDAREVTQQQDDLIALFRPPADIRKAGGLAAGPDIWVTKQWCTFIWASPAKKRPVVTINAASLWKSEEFTQMLPEVTKSLIDKSGDCQRALKFMHSHGPDQAKMRVKCFSVIYFSPERPFQIWSNTSLLTAYIYWDWYLSRKIPRQLKHAMKLTINTRFEKAPAHTLGANPTKPPPQPVERPDPPTVKGTTEAWMNPKYPMDDWFASVRNDNTKKIVLIVLAVLLSLAMLGAAGFVLYYFLVKKPAMDDDEGYEKVETAYTTPAEGGTPETGSNEGLKLD